MCSKLGKCLKFGNLTVCMRIGEKQKLY